MERPPESPKKPDDVARVDLQQQAERNMKGLLNPPSKKVNYNELRPLTKPPESKTELYSKAMKTEAYRKSKLPEETRSAWQILEDQRKTSLQPKKDEGH